MFATHIGEYMATRPKISAKEFLADVRSGMTDEELVGKYRISRQSVQNLLSQLVSKGFMTQGELDKRGPVQDGFLSTRLIPSFKCPKCGLPQIQGRESCLDCGVIFSQYSDDRQEEQICDVSVNQSNRLLWVGVGTSVLVVLVVVLLFRHFKDRQTPYVPMVRSASIGEQSVMGNRKPDPETRSGTYDPLQEAQQVFTASKKVFDKAPKKPVETVDPRAQRAAPLEADSRSSSSKHLLTRKINRLNAQLRQIVTSKKSKDQFERKTSLCNDLIEAISETMSCDGVREDARQHLNSAKQDLVTLGNEEDIPRARELFWSYSETIGEALKRL